MHTKHIECTSVYNLVCLSDGLWLYGYIQFCDFQLLTKAYKNRVFKSETK